MNSGKIETTGHQPEPSPALELRRWIRLTGPEVASLVGETVDNWFQHNVPRLGASLAFYTMLSLAPLLIVATAIAGLVFGQQAAEGQLFWQLQDLLGPDGATAVQGMVRGARRPGAGILATSLGLVTLFFGATSVVAELRNALNTIWCVPAKPAQSRIRSVVYHLKDRARAFGLVLGTGFFLLVSLTLNAILAAAGQYAHWVLPTPEWLLELINFAVSFAVIAFLFAVLFRILPDLRIEWRDVALGAAITSLLFTFGKLILALYLGKAGFTTSYGAAGSLVIVLVWVYYSAQIFFLGAEFTQVYAQRYGSRPCDRIGREVKIVRNIPTAGEAS